MRDRRISIEGAVQAVKEWRKNGETIAFTNGCFDLLHPGHIQLLYGTHHEADRVIVGLNSDASIKRLKGTSRPIQSQEDRAIMLSAIWCVDIVVIFDEDTPLEVIKALRPDVLTKGSDYANKLIVGEEFVRSYGGSTRLVLQISDHSTTRLVASIK